MIKAILERLYDDGHTQTRSVELPDVVYTGDILSVIADNKKNFDYKDWMKGDGDTFIIYLENGKRFYYLESPNIFKKWTILVQDPHRPYRLFDKFNYYKELKK